jgi:DNA invertase Pin-like site-specific DNA recombinase
MRQLPGNRHPPGAPIARPRCATYVRTAVETTCDSGLAALDAQRDACVAFLRGELGATWIASFEDLGCSGFGLKRPALQRLLADIDAGVIDIVVVVGVSRLSRSSRGRATLLTHFQRAGVSLVVVGSPTARPHAAHTASTARGGARP